MALGKPRSAGRRSSSSSSYTTVYMLIFIVFGVVALWVLTSTNVVPQSSTTATTRATNAFPSDSSSSSSSNSQYSKPKRKDPPAFEDTQGDLPDDAIKGDTTKTVSQQTLIDGAKDPEVTATAEQQGGGDTTTQEEEKPKAFNVEVNLQEKEINNVNVDNNEGNENTPKPKEEDESNANQTKEDSSKENAQQTQQETESTESTETTETTETTEIQNTVKETQQEAEVEIKEENQQQIQHETETESSQKIEHDTQGTTEAETSGSNGNSQETQESETNSQQTNQQLENENHQESETHDNSQQAQQETDTGSNEQTQSDTGSSNKPEQEMSDTTMNHQQLQQQDETQQQQQQQQLLEDQGIIDQNSQSQSQQSENQESQQQQSDSNQETEKGSGGTGGSGGLDSKLGGIPKESHESKESWSTQENQSENQKERRKDEYNWELCNVTAGTDYIPCLDNEKALKQIHSTGHFEHRERHCPEEGPTCLVALPSGYKKSIEWPKSRDKIWYHNVPHTKLAEVKGHQNWVKVTGEFLTFPGGGTQFIHGALHYIEFIEQSVPNIAWGKRTRVILDVGCGVASFGGFLFEKDVLAMSFAPKDEHEAQVQFALERGIPAISAVMGTKRLPFPSRVFDIVHCARCRVPWHAEGGTLLLELNRVLRPGGYFVWSATPVYQKLEEDVEIWKAMSSLTASMCWNLITIKKDKLNGVGAAIYQKPVTNDCYEHRKHNKPPMCKEDDDANAAWYVPLQACMHRVPVDESKRGARWPEKWPARVHTPPYWLSNTQKGIYGKSAPDDFATDYEHWKQVVTKTYMTGLGISWSNVRNVMDMRAVYGGFAAALKDLKVWVMNVVNVDCPDTLPIIYERGLFGIYHDWCESFSTYPRTYDLLHADHLFSTLKQRCNLVPVIAEVDRIVRPGGKIIVRDEETMIWEIENILKSLHWEIQLTFSKDQQGILSAQKTDWRPKTYSLSS